MFERLSIRSKLLALLSLSSALALLIFSLVALYFTYESERRASLRSLHQMADVISENLRAAIAFHDVDSVSKLLAPLRANPHILLARVHDEHGHLLSSYHKRQLGSTLQAELENRLATAEAALAAQPRLEQLVHTHHWVSH